MTLAQLFALVAADPEMGQPKRELGDGSDLIRMAAMG